jgi:hypothetical protein
VSTPDPGIADLYSLLSKPPFMRRGYTAEVVAPSPAAGAGWAYKVDNAWYERPVALAALLTTSGAAGARGLAIGYADADGNLVDVTPAGAGIGPSQTLQVYADLSGTPAVPAPVPTPVTAAFAAGVAGTATLPAGASLAGFTVTAASTAAAENGTITVSNVPGGPLLYSFVFPNGGNGAPDLSITFPAPLPSTGSPITVAINAVTSGSAGNIVAYGTPGGSAAALAAYPQLPDLILRPGWQLELNVPGVQAADQLSAIILLTERYPSDWASGTLAEDTEARIREALAQLLTRG